MKRCGVKGCKNVHRARGYCILHYRRWMRYGDASIVKHPRTSLEVRTAIEEWYDARVKLGPMKTLAHRLGVNVRTVQGIILRYRYAVM